MRRSKKTPAGLDREIAQMLVMTATRVMCELGDLAPLLKKHGGSDQSDIKLALGSAIYEVGLVRRLAFKKHPALEAEYEARANKYGRGHY